MFLSPLCILFSIACGAQEENKLFSRIHHQRMENAVYTVDVPQESSKNKVLTAFLAEP